MDGLALRNQSRGHGEGHGRLIGAGSRFATTPSYDRAFEGFARLGVLQGFPQLGKETRSEYRLDDRRNAWMERVDGWFAPGVAGELVGVFLDGEVSGVATVNGEGP